MDVLDDIGGLLIGRAEAAREPPQFSPAPLVMVDDSEFRGFHRLFGMRSRGALCDVHALPTLRDQKTQRLLCCSRSCASSEVAEPTSRPMTLSTPASR